MWAGKMSPVPPDVIQRLKSFVASCDWTGGGELEFVETIDISLSPLKEWYIIDFNTRLPAWIGAGIYTGCNLPADLICHMGQSLKGNSNWFMDDYLSFTDCEYVKSIVEVPVVHVNNGRKCIFHGIAQARVAKGSMKLDDSDLLTKLPGGQNVESRYERALGQENEIQSCSAEVREPNFRITEPLQLVCDAASVAVRFLHCTDGPNGTIHTHTPLYVLSEGVYKKNLARFACLLETSLENTLFHGDSMTPEPNFNVQMAISVKTQPRREVLCAAYQQGYLAECISMAEVRVALDVGFSAYQIILTGPGKFYEKISEPEKKIQGLGREGASLAGIYADSVSDLLEIIHRVTNCDDWLKAQLIGVRFQPVGNCLKSRFGIDASNPATLAAVASIIRESVPDYIKLGVHFHYAASAPGTGIPFWFGMAKANAVLASDFAAMCNRPLSVLDFGGGFPSHFVDSPLASSGLCNLFEHANKLCCANEITCQTTTIQFELGKSITENSGGLICNILAIREVNVTYNDEPEKDLRTDSSRAALNNAIGGVIEKYAIIVDACVGEISDYSHVHPLFWRPRDSSSVDIEWNKFSPGKDEIWGRTCMEFDVLVGSSGGWGTGTGTCGGGGRGICLPDNIKPGDYILIGNCGSYDMSMQYDFGDGAGRSNCFVHKDNHNCKFS